MYLSLRLLYRWIHPLYLDSSGCPSCYRYALLYYTRDATGEAIEPNPPIALVMATPVVASRFAAQK